MNKKFYDCFYGCKLDPNLIWNCKMFELKKDADEYNEYNEYIKKETTRF